MLFSILMSVFICGFWLFNTKKVRKTIIRYIAILGLCVIWILFFIMPNTIDSHSQHRLFLMFCIVCFIGFFFYLKQILTKAPLDVVAKQQSYWDISAKHIYRHFAFRLSIVRKRIETQTNPQYKKFYRVYSNNAKFITANLFLDFTRLSLTKVETTKQLKQYPLYHTIYTKLLKIIDEKEIILDYETILQENSYYAEYFLMDLWEQYTQDINIGIAHLHLLATRYIERELIGALDNIDLNSIKRIGACLYYKYMEHKNKIPITSKKIQQYEDL